MSNDFESRLSKAEVKVERNQQDIQAIFGSLEDFPKQLRNFLLKMGAGGIATILGVYITNLLTK